MYLLGDLKKKMQELGIHPKKSLGQNFLINPDSVKKIVTVAEKLNGASFVEVGPGLGAITEFLTSKPLLVIEMDAKFSQMWRDKGVTVIEEDALRIDWDKLDIPKPIVLVSNLPYQISSSLVIDRSMEPCGVEAMVLMFQKEVAQRIMSACGNKEYGLLSVIAQTFWKIEKLFEVSSKDFYPPPQVASRVLVFRRQNPLLDAKYLPFVKAAFAQRRKLLINNLSSVCDALLLEEFFEKNDISLTARAEDLSPLQYIEMYRKLKT